MFTKPDTSFGFYCSMLFCLTADIILGAPSWGARLRWLNKIRTSGFAVGVKVGNLAISTKAGGVAISAAAAFDKAIPASVAIKGKPIFLN